MKRYILSALTAGAFMVASAYAQTAATPAPGSTQAEAQRFEQRQDNQAARIQNGVNSGKLTQQQAARLTAKDQRIAQEAAKMKAKNGGQLSQRQEKKIRRQMNRQSRRIRRAKR